MKRLIEAFFLRQFANDEIVSKTDFMQFLRHALRIREKERLPVNASAGFMELPGSFQNEIRIIRCIWFPIDTERHSGRISIKPQCEAEHLQRLLFRLRRIAVKPHGTDLRHKMHRARKIFCIKLSLHTVIIYRNGKISTETEKISKE